MLRWPWKKQLEASAHLEDEHLLLLIDGELPSRAAQRAVEHLESCWTCRARKQKMDSAIALFVESDARGIGSGTPPGEWREFPARLERAAAEEDPPRRPIAVFRRRAFSKTSAGTLLVAAAALAAGYWSVERNTTRPAQTESVQPIVAGLPLAATKPAVRARPEEPAAAVSILAPAGVVLPAPSAADIANRAIDYELEIHRLGACGGEEVRISHTTGSVRIEGTVASEERKSAIVSALARAGQPPWVTVVIGVVGSSTGGRISTADETLQANEIGSRDGAELPIEPILRSYLTRTQSAAQASAKNIAEFSTNVLAHASGSVREGWALRRLAEQYDPQSLSQQAKAELAVMARDHASGMASEIHAAASAVRPLLPGAAVSPQPSEDNSATWRDSVAAIFEDVARFESYSSYLFGGDKSGAVTGPDEALRSLAASVPLLEQHLDAARRKLAAVFPPSQLQ